MELSKKFAAKTMRISLNFFDKWIETEYENWLEDGLHANSDGHEKIFQEVKVFLIKNKLV